MVPLAIMVIKLPKVTLFKCIAFLNSFQSRFQKHISKKYVYLYFYVIDIQEVHFRKWSRYSVVCLSYRSVSYLVPAELMFCLKLTALTLQYLFFCPWALRVLRILLQRYSVWTVSRCLLFLWHEGGKVIQWIVEIQMSRLCHSSSSYLCIYIHTHAHT